MSDAIVSIIRTVVPAIVGTIVAQALKAGIDIDGTAVSSALTPVAIGGYYALVRWAETRWPKAGMLLGVPRPPSYTKV